MVINNIVRLYLPVTEPVGSWPAVQAAQYRDHDALNQITTWVEQLRTRGMIDADVHFSIRARQGEPVGFLDAPMRPVQLLAPRSFLVLSERQLRVVDHTAFLRDHRDLNDLYRHSPTSGSPAADSVVDLSGNEMANLPTTAVVNAIIRAASEVNQSETDSTDVLCRSLADHVGVDPARLAVGSSTTCMQAQLVTAFRTDHIPVEILTATPLSTADHTRLAVAGPAAVRTRVVPLVDHRVNLPGMLDAITSETQIVFVSNPNDLTGTALQTAELTEFLDRVPEHVQVVVDETYREFVTDPDVPDGVALAEGRPNVVVLRRSLTAYALAGLRLGYLVATPDAAETIRAAGAPLRISRLGEAAAVAAMSTVGPASLYCAAVVDERTRVRNLLRAAGYMAPLSEANFVWLPLGPDTARFAAHCADRHVLVRPYPDLGIRVTTSSNPAENNAFLDAACEFGGS